MKRLCILLFTVLLSHLVISQPKSIVIRMSSVYTSFPDTARYNGHLYHGVNYEKQMHYTDSSVLIIIPPSFKPDHKINIVFWFHGWNNNIDTALSYYQIQRQFEEANINAVLVLAETARNAPDSYGGKLEQKGIFQNLVNDIINKMYQNSVIKRKNRAGKILLAGHSGAYRVIANIISRGGLNINQVMLFDALYANSEEFKSWMTENKGHRFINLFTNVGGTDGETAALMQVLKTEKIPFFFCEENMATADVLKENRILFIHSMHEHNDIIFKPDNFKLFLETGVLKN